MRLTVAFQLDAVDSPRARHGHKRAYARLCLPLDRASAPPGRRELSEDIARVEVGPPGQTGGALSSMPGVSYRYTASLARIRGQRTLGRGGLSATTERPAPRRSAARQSGGRGSASICVCPFLDTFGITRTTFGTAEIKGCDL